MSAAGPVTQFGRIYPPDEAWLAKQPSEPILDPDLPIIDPHHHLWDRPNHRYLLEDFLADVRSGHHVVATLFEECHSMYRADGPEELRHVGGPLGYGLYAGKRDEVFAIWNTKMTAQAT